MVWHLHGTILNPMARRLVLILHVCALLLGSAQARQTYRRTPRPIITKGNPINKLPRRARRGLVVGVMGSAAPESTIPTELRGRLARLGSYLGHKGHVILTGACPGMPQVCALAAKRAGGYCVGVSPAGSLQEHTKRFHSPTKGLDVIQMTGCGPGMGLIAREKQNIKHSDILVFAGGRSGTLGEILFAMTENKVVALLDDSTGVTAKFKKQILPLIGRGRGVFVSDRDPVRLMDKAVSAHGRLKRSPTRQKTTLGQLARELRERITRKHDPKRASPRRREPVVVDHTKQAINDQTPRRHNIFTFFGTRRGMNGKDRASVERLVDCIAKDATGGRKPLLVTPARNGLNSVVAGLAKKRGVKTVGISHARTPDQLRRPGRPRKMFDVIQLTGEGQGVGELAAYRHAISRADVVFVAGGDEKTLGGTVFAMYQPTVVAVLETHGKTMSGKLRSDILSTFNKPAHAKMIYDSDPVRLYSRAIKAAAELRHVEKTEYIAPE
jgi:predicted Rossmann-fold nucleotide-binding protein